MLPLLICKKHRQQHCLGYPLIKSLHCNPITYLVIFQSLLYHKGCWERCGLTPHFAKPKCSFTFRWDYLPPLPGISVPSCILTLFPQYALTYSSASNAFQRRPHPVQCGFYYALLPAGCAFLHDVSGCGRNTIPEKGNSPPSLAVTSTRSFPSWKL